MAAAVAMPAPLANMTMVGYLTPLHHTAAAATAAEAAAATATAAAVAAAVAAEACG